MSSYKDYKKRALQNPKVKEEYDALQLKYDIIQTMIDARVHQLSLIHISEPTRRS